MTWFTDGMSAAIVGAILGAAVAHSLTILTERRRALRTGQRLLLGEIAILHANWKAALTLYDDARRNSPTDTRRLAESAANLIQLEGRSLQLAFELMPHYTHRAIRASHEKLRSRFMETKALLMAPTIPSERLRDLAFRWIDDQAERFARKAASAADIPTKDNSGGFRGVMWVGWGRKANERWRKEYEEMDFSDREPPWRPDVRSFVQGVPPGENEMQRAALSKISGLVCSEHERAVHLTLHGRKSNFTIDFEVCCPKMAKLAEKALQQPGPKGASFGR